MDENNEAKREQCPICGEPYLNLYDTAPDEADPDAVCRGDDAVYVHGDDR